MLDCIAFCLVLSGLVSYLADSETEFSNDDINENYL